MPKTPITSERSQSLGEEIANSISHGIGLVVAIIAGPILVITAVRDGNALTIIGASVFAATLVLLYLASTIYHALPQNKAKNLFQMFDHIAIFLLIAGTYTPFTLGVLRGTWGWTIFALIWGLALLGVTQRVVGGGYHPWFSTGLYLGMGWLVLIAIRTLWVQLPLPGILWLAGGGIAYTVGVAFFVAERIRYSHFVWHLFVLTGSVCHFFAVLWYAGSSQVG